MVAGETVQRQVIPSAGQSGTLQRRRLQLRVGNRDLYGFDFRWIDESEIVSRTEPNGLYLVERREYGPLIGSPVRIVEGDRKVASGPVAVRPRLAPLLEKARRDRG